MPQTSQNPLPHDLSPWGMFVAADIVVQAVMLGLLFAAVLTWVVWLAKTWELRGANRQARAALTALRQASSLAEAGDDDGGPLHLFCDTARHERRHSEGLTADGVKERAAASLGRIEASLGRHINRGTGILATIGATAPFVGLFGTVWGIMNAFIGISKAQTTNLAVVAPGIAEALLATALGLFAAIPAVIIYNAFARSTAAYRALLADASTEVLNLLSRDLDRGTA
mgnify:FL=1